MSKIPFPNSLTSATIGIGVVAAADGRTELVLFGRPLGREIVSGLGTKANQFDGNSPYISVHFSFKLEFSEFTIAGSSRTKNNKRRAPHGLPFSTRLPHELSRLAPPPQIIQQVEIDSIWFERILALRASAYGKAEAGIRDEFDGYSFHYAAILDNQIVGSIRLTIRNHGALECETNYPEWILESYGSILGAASRLCVLPGNDFGPQLPFSLASHVILASLALGIRIHVTKARIDAIAYWMRLGYLFVRGSFFHFDRTDVVCGLVAYPANPEHKGKFSQLFVGIESPCDLTDPEISDRFTSSYREVTHEYEKFKKDFSKPTK